MNAITDWENGNPLDSRLWLERPRSSLPMTARAYATMIMEDLRRAGMDIPLTTLQGYTTQDTVTAIVETAMQKAVETHRETRWWKRLERRLTHREWP
jgi:S-adenosylhomocysteine hydrolase